MKYLGISPTKYIQFMMLNNKTHISHRRPKQMEACNQFMDRGGH